jgi:hypothetical protein
LVQTTSSDRLNAPVWVFTGRYRTAKAASGVGAGGVGSGGSGGESLRSSA